MKGLPSRQPFFYPIQVRRKTRTCFQAKPFTFDRMALMTRLLLASVLWATMGCGSANGQVQTYLTKGKTTVATGQPDPIRKGPGNVHCILQDKHGNLWFGTTGQGVFRYDGKSFTHFTTRGGLNGNAVSSMVEDRKGNIWFGTDAGLALYDGKTFAHIPLSFTGGSHAYPPASPNGKVPPDNAVTSMLEDRSGKLWFGTDSGVYRYDGKVFTRFLTDPAVTNDHGLSLRLVQGMVEDKRGNIWFTTKLEGVCRFDGRSIIHYEPDGELWFRGLLEDRKGNIWVGTRYKGVYRYDGKTFTHVAQGGSFDSYTVLSIIQDRAGYIWFGTEAGDEAKRETEGGLWRYDGKAFQNLSKPGDLVHPAVWSILQDRSGDLWIGTRNTGLCRYDGKTFTGFSE
jgi:ligand-binding sensor domain-containing protein